jgi:S1-C subfamily serine protease
MNRRLTAIATLTVFLSGTPAFGFSPEILQSVVGVLPEWPAGDKPKPAPAGRPEEPEGSAVAVLPGGYLATNAHVLRRAERLKVRLHDGRLLPATIVGRDPPTDLALIKVTLDLPVPAINPKPTLAARVCAIGNQFGLGLSVTCGVVSALNRTGTGFNPVEDFIQTDAVVNPGGSGGALIDDQSRLVGVLSAIFTKQSDANIGVNFAASMPLVLRVVQDLRDFGRVKRGTSGMTVEDLTKEEKSRLVGARVVRVHEGGAAAEAGLAVGDIMVAIGGRAVAKASDVTSAFYLQRPGDSVEVIFVREGRRQTTRLATRP